jgi:hypothetical protein
MTDVWNTPPHRYYISYTSRGNFRHVLGLPVIDEFATFSSPIFFAPQPILGKIYNAGISLGHLRDPEMGIETGWPPLCITTFKESHSLPEAWEQILLTKLQSMDEATVRADDPRSGKFTQVEEFAVQLIQLDSTCVIATNAPMLPKQLKKISQLSNYPFSVAFATGNRLSTARTELLKVEALSERVIHYLESAIRELLVAG